MYIIDTEKALAGRKAAILCHRNARSPGWNIALVGEELSPFGLSYEQIQAHVEPFWALTRLFESELTWDLVVRLAVEIDRANDRFSVEAQAPTGSSFAAEWERFRDGVWRVRLAETAELVRFQPASMHELRLAYDHPQPLRTAPTVVVNPGPEQLVISTNLEMTGISVKGSSEAIDEAVRRIVGTCGVPVVWESPQLAEMLDREWLEKGSEWACDIDFP